MVPCIQKFLLTAFKSTGSRLFHAFLFIGWLQSGLNCSVWCSKNTLDLYQLLIYFIFYYFVVYQFVRFLFRRHSWKPRWNYWRPPRKIFVIIIYCFIFCYLIHDWWSSPIQVKTGNGGVSSVLQQRTTSLCYTARTLWPLIYTWNI